MPWERFSSDEMLHSAIGSGFVQCGLQQGEVFVAAFRHRSAVYVMWFEPQSRKIVFLYDPNPNDKNALPTEIGFGHVDNDKHDTVPPLTWMPFDVRTHGNLCAVMFNSGV